MADERRSEMQFFDVVSSTQALTSDNLFVKATEMHSSYRISARLDCRKANDAVQSVLFFVILSPNVAFSRGTGWRGLCSAQTVTDRTVGYNAWLGVFVIS